MLETLAVQKLLDDEMLAVLLADVREWRTCSGEKWHPRRTGEAFKRFHLVSLLVPPTQVPFTVERKDFKSLVTGPREADAIQLMRAVADYVFGCRHKILGHSWAQDLKSLLEDGAESEYSLKTCRLSVDRKLALVRDIDAAIGFLQLMHKNCIGRLISLHEEFQPGKIN